MDAYIYQADIYCEDCAEDIKQDIFAAANSIDDMKPLNDSDGFPQGPFSNGGGEADSPQHCGSCGVFLENSLTDDGQEYVRKALALPLKMCTRETDRWRLLWKRYYDYL